MSKKLISFFTLLLTLLISLSTQECQIYTKNCTKCNPITQLCVMCDKKIYKPDQEGGCEPSHQCIIGENYCNECNDKGDLCSICESGLFADENGGCSYSDNCVISENGSCLQCKDDFYLIVKSDVHICKSKFSDDFKNCAEIDFYLGNCASCKEGFYRNFDDKKCSNTDFCRKSSFGICTECDTGFFLDKTDDLCKNETLELNYCKISLDGKICSECVDGYFLSEDGFCSRSQNCAKINNSNCIECSEGYFLTKYGNICTTEVHCMSADIDFGFCEVCEESFYIEVESGKCFSNQEDEKYKFCSNVSLGKCMSCENGYQLGKDNKCVSSPNCLESENGICVICEEGYHLGLDNICINVEKCIYTNILGECIECEKYYYFDTYENKCFPAINQYKDCKKAYSPNKYCERCKDDFYLSSEDKMCYSNNEEGEFYKCAFSNGITCIDCIYGYSLGIKDNKCSKIENCAISENENKCIECDEYMCLDVKKQICIENYNAPENEEQKIYFNCNKTNEEGTECEICNDYTELINGICVDKVECVEEKDGECVKCKEISSTYFDMCLNTLYGCVETSVLNCLRCDNVYNFNECTECKEGFELDDKSNCVDKEGF